MELTKDAAVQKINEETIAVVKTGAGLGSDGNKFFEALSQNIEQNLCKKNALLQGIGSQQEQNQAVKQDQNAGTTLKR